MISEAMVDIRTSLNKKAFYKQLSALDNDDDGDEVDAGRQASEDALRKAAERATAAWTTANQKASGSPHPPSTVNLLSSHTEKRAEMLSATNSMAPKHVPPRLKKANTEPADTRTHPEATGKRKRKSTPKTVPEAQQLFKGFHFYFFPNNDIAPARRMRISKAVEYGATWQKDWSIGVTHAILDKSMTSEGLLKFLKLPSLPDYVVVVHENYPAECIAYRTLLDPQLAQFVVKGLQPDPTGGSRPNDRNVSLELKSARKDVKTRAIETQQAKEVDSNGFSDMRLDLSGQEQELPDRPGERVQAPNPETTDEFSEVLQQAKALQNLPLDDDEDLQNTRSGTDDQPPRLRLLKKRKPNFQNFQCMQKHTGDKSGSPNLATINMLQQMADYYGNTGDEWRVRAYRKAIATLRNHPTKVATKEEALKLPNVGERLASKIEEIAFTNRLQRLEQARAEPGDHALQMFLQIYGVGFVQASKWVHEGYTTLDDLLQKAELTDSQRIGIAHYDDFAARIPREEVAQHGQIVRAALQQIDPGFEVIIGGSYRRGALTSGDIDCIITRPGADAAALRSAVLDRAVPALSAAGFLVAALATSSRNDGSKWLGASRLPGRATWRRIDLLLVPAAERGAALIYFTGNDIFNRSLRLLARKKGMRLNQRGLYRDVMRGKVGLMVTEGTLVEGRDEKRIFEILGVPWRPPEHRVC